MKRPLFSSITFLLLLTACGDGEQGGLGEPCYENETCDDSYVCEDDLCVERGTGEGGLDEPCYENETCDDPYVCDAGFCAVQDPPPGQTPPATPSLTLTVVQDTAPGEVRLNWSASPGASSCTAESSPVVSQWNGSVGTGTSQQTILSNLNAGSYVFRLRCSNSAGTSPNAQVTANIAAPVVETCANRAPPEGWVRMSTGGQSCVFLTSVGWDSSADCRTWAPGIWPAPFLQTGGLTFRLGARQAHQYLAIALDTNGLTPLTYGQIYSSEPGGTTMVNPRRIWSISSCPGDFHRDAVLAENGCYGQMTSISHIFWGGTGAGRACKLEPNRTYYLNIIATDDPLGTPPDQIQPAPECNTSACGATYSPQVTIQ